MPTIHLTNGEAQRVYSLLRKIRNNIRRVLQFLDFALGEESRTIWLGVKEIWRLANKIQRNLNAAEQV
jgi:hypothetical protein